MGMSLMRRAGVYLLFAIAVAAIPLPSNAADNVHQLARDNGCFNCHSVETDDIGPAWKRVAEKYRGDAAAEERLVNKVTRGGKGVWGYLPMPSFAARLNEEQIRSLVKYILALK